MALRRDAAPAVADAAQLTAPLTDPVVISPGELSAQALRGVIESFVLREGTDYGERECPLEQKVAQVRAQLERGQARIVFDPESGTVTIELVP